MFLEKCLKQNENEKWISRSEEWWGKYIIQSQKLALIAEGTLLFQFFSAYQREPRNTDTTLPMS